MESHKLIIVGTGIKSAGQLTSESISWIKKADKVFYVTDPLVSKILDHLNSSTKSLSVLYKSGKSRRKTYNEMVESIMESVRRNPLTVAAFYGHPGIFADAPHESIRQARAEGFDAEMLPSVSAEACLYADLGVDPSTYGCQSYEATGFLIRKKAIDNTSALILWQIGTLGILTHETGLSVPKQNMDVLLEKLYKHYPPSHRITIYEAATVIGCKPKIITIPLSDLSNAPVSKMSTLYIPPSSKERADSEILNKVELIE